jgi:hypothetical protein
MSFDNLNPDKPKEEQKLIVGTRDMTHLDDLTHDFMDSEPYRQAMLKKYGQYFKDGRRYFA